MKKTVSNTSEVLKEVYQELGFQKRISDYLFEIDEEAFSQRTMKDLCELIVKAFYFLSGGNAVVMRLYDEKTDSLILKAAVGVDQHWMNKSKVKFGGGIMEEAFRKGRPLLVDDLSKEKKYTGIKLAQSHGFKTSIGIPLFAKKEPIGSLSVYFRNPEKVKALDWDFLNGFGRHSSAAIFIKTMQVKK